MSYDTGDKLFLWFIAIAFVGMIAMIPIMGYYAYQNKTKCEAAGGVYKAGRDFHMCLDPKVIIEVK